MIDADVEDFFDTFLVSVVGDDSLHCTWLNTLSLMENVGARKISASQHPQQVTEDVLRHAFEESRHAWYLKRQIRKISETACPTYDPSFLFVPKQSYRYLHALDVSVARNVKAQLGLSGFALKKACYLLVTYAIEVRADWLYSRYEAVLREQGSPVSVRSIILEEEGHLEEMESGITEFFGTSEDWRAQSCAAEQAIFARWVSHLRTTIVYRQGGNLSANSVYKC